MLLSFPILLTFAAFEKDLVTYEVEGRVYI